MSADARPPQDRLTHPLARVLGHARQPVLALRAMRKTNRVGLLVAAIAILMLSGVQAGAAELDVRVEPENRALRENIENYIGDLAIGMRASCCATAGWRSVRLEKALQALGYYRSRIRTDVRARARNRPWCCECGPANRCACATSPCAGRASGRVSLSRRPAQPAPG